jgi:biopolymer transport protein ExbD
VRDRVADKLDKTVYVKSDARAKYGDVVSVVDAVRAAGVDSIGLLAEKVQTRASAAAGAAETQ